MNRGADMGYNLAFGSFALCVLALARFQHYVRDWCTRACLCVYIAYEAGTHVGRGRLRAKTCHLLRALQKTSRR